MHSTLLTSSPDSSMLAGDVFFHFLPPQPALVTRFDLAYPGVTTANYMASFSFHFLLIFPPELPPLSPSNTSFSSLFPVWVAALRTWLIPPSAAWTSLFFVWIVGSVLLLSYPHLILKNLLCL